MNRFSKRDLPYFNLYHSDKYCLKERLLTALGLLEGASLKCRSISVSKILHTIFYIFFKKKKPHNSFFFLGLNHTILRRVITLQTFVLSYSKPSEQLRISAMLIKQCVTTMNPNSILNLHFHLHYYSMITTSKKIKK